MICFHFTIFVVLETTVFEPPVTSVVLWFAFILLSLSYWKQLYRVPPPPPTRCDLLSFYYLCRTGNNELLQSVAASLLWFAFILLSLSYWKQPYRVIGRDLESCDLLSFYYLCRTGNNLTQRLPLSSCVVICFHFTIFVVLETTPRIHLPKSVVLWFAFILLSLSYWKQPLSSMRKTWLCCDLLSFYYLCRTGNNIRLKISKYKKVVICFHFTIFVVLETTKIETAQSCVRCDLLSFYYLCRTGNNKTLFINTERIVVICFHFTIFVVLETTSHGGESGLHKLWFAFILLSLSYWKQLAVKFRLKERCCDLLSFYYLCRTGNNWLSAARSFSCVVICFHFTIFVVLETTRHVQVPCRIQLWFAFILLSLSYWKQLK